MKRYIKSNENLDNKDYLISFIFTCVHYDNIAATEYVTKPIKPSKKWVEYSKQELSDYNFAIGSVLSIISHEGFTPIRLSDERQSSYSYTYYKTYKYDMNDPRTFACEFGISDHNLPECSEVDDKKTLTHYRVIININDLDRNKLRNTVIGICNNFKKNCHITKANELKHERWFKIISKERNLKLRVVHGRRYSSYILSDKNNEYIFNDDKFTNMTTIDDLRKYVSEEIDYD